MTVTPLLDHIVILLPIEELRSLPPWLTDNFTISPGGTHADGRTENVLILLSDGVYLELIAFTESTSPKARARHRWGSESYGIIDYALTVDSDNLDEDYAQLVKNWKEAGVNDTFYASSLVDGGRTRPDGEVLKWKIAAPDQDNTGLANFWCLDVTPRRLRVPITMAATTHPSGVIGVQSVTINTGDQAEALDKLFRSYLPATSSGFSIGNPVHPEAEGLNIQVSNELNRPGIQLALRTTKETRSIRGELGGVELDISLVA